MKCSAADFTRDVGSHDIERVRLLGLNISENCGTSGLSGPTLKARSPAAGVSGPSWLCVDLMYIARPDSMFSKRKAIEGLLGSFGTRLARNFGMEFIDTGRVDQVEFEHAHLRYGRKRKYLW